MVPFIGVISDTHGLLRPQAVAALAGCDHIIHAGDVGRPEVLTELRRIAPVTAVRGNVDLGSWAESLPPAAHLVVHETKILVLHDLEDLKLDPAVAGFSVVIYGHSHKPSLEHRKGVLFLNPGSAGRRRFSLPVTLARLDLEQTGVAASLVRLLE